MERYWTIGALLLGCVLMGNACLYSCVAREHCELEATIFDYRSKNCTSPQICCAFIRQNIFAQQPNFYPPREDPVRPYDPTATQRPNGAGIIQPNGPADHFAGPNGNQFNQKPTYGAGNPPVSPPPPSYPTRQPPPRPYDQTVTGGIPATQWPNGAGIIQPNGPAEYFAGPNGNPFNQQPIYGGGIGNRPNAPNGNTFIAAGRPPITGGNPPVSTGNIYNPTIPGGNSQPSKTSGGPQNHPKGLEQSEECGLSNPNGLQFIAEVTKDQALPGQYPWSVVLIHQGEYLAGGSLIKPGVVLTAAHRLVGVSHTDLLVRAGDWDLGTTREQFKAEHREVERIQSHERFNFTSSANNLALLFLKSEFQLSNHIRTICLPKARKSFEGRRCMVAGWGKIKFDDESHSTILKRVELPMVDRRTCQRQLQQTRLGSHYQLPESLICAGGEIDQDACSGDGGSALFCSVGGENSGLFEQAGIVNWGINCGQKDVPGTYTDVAMFRHWIDEQLLPFKYRLADGPHQ
ncbi:phenoloxidase-activating factor 2 [Drosophila takahashii]|uniref:phenoloxidase-activating factor 2 n=1 Tax=Drosophila takahashii TaxID=29030 RepID=UPI001CF811F6|nr:serine protease 44 [Drosophila takahashii]